MYYVKVILSLTIVIFFFCFSDSFFICHLFVFTLHPYFYQRPSVIWEYRATQPGNPRTLDVKDSGSGIRIAQHAMQIIAALAFLEALPHASNLRTPGWHNHANTMFD